MGNLAELSGAVAAFTITMLAAGLTVLATYLVVLTVAAVLARPSLDPPGPGRRRFAVLVPAHNEELTVGRLLRSLAELDWPTGNYDVCVVADNCEDRTAQIARSFGARVYERFTEAEHAKGYALRWLLEQLSAEARLYDAFVVLDADTVVQADLLQRFDARLEAGSQVIQVYYTVLNARASGVAGLRFAALSALHYLRPLGRAALRLSCGLKGNGMCFAAPVIERFPWRWYTLAEDVEFHLALVREGIRVDFAWETSVLADMPVSLEQARTQNARWEQGRLQLLKTQVPKLFLEGLRKRSLLRLDAAVEQLIPPLSVPVVLASICLIAGLALGSRTAVVLAGLSLAGQLAYLLTGLALVRAPWRAYLALSSAPVYITWKFGLYAQALVSARATAWVRTTRVP